MDFTYTDEQRQLRDTLSRYLAKEYDFARRREMLRSPATRTHWKAFADLGVLALTIPEGDGGLGGNAIDAMVVAEALGRALVVEPYVGAVVVAGGLVADAGNAAQRAALLAPIAGGALILALAHYELGDRYELNGCATTARRAGDGYVIDGAKSVVLGGGEADRLLVSARTSDTRGDAQGISLFVVDRSAQGVAVRDYPTQDGMRAAEIAFRSVPVAADALVGQAGEAFSTIERAIDRGTAALCGEAVGVMAALTDATLEYVKTREQFGGPIGRFQALQHRIVDMFIATEQARSMAILASVGVQSANRDERRRAVAMGKAMIGQSGRFVGQQAVQLHGGMGVTDELIVGHYFKRLTTINATYGDADHHLGLVSDGLLAA